MSERLLTVGELGAIDFRACPPVGAKALRTIGVQTWEDLTALAGGDLLTLVGFGATSWAWLRANLEERGLHLDDGPLPGPGAEVAIAKPFPKNPRQGVYFLRGGELIKIGISNNVVTRCGAVRCMSPVDVIGAGFIQFDSYEAAERHELALHERFAPDRHHAEWFRESAELLALVESSQRWPRR